MMEEEIFIGNQKMKRRDKAMIGGVAGGTVSISVGAYFLFNSLFVRLDKVIDNMADLNTKIAVVIEKDLHKTSLINDNKLEIKDLKKRIRDIETGKNR